MSRKRFGRYEVVRKIGEGGSGVVYEGFDPANKRRVAVKTCSSRETEASERFLREASIAGGLRHRNIVVVLDYGLEEETAYLVEEFLDGEDLDRRLQRSPRLELGSQLAYLAQIARGLAYAHGQGVVHRDLRPETVRIQDNDVVKILDFGTARSLDGTSLTSSGDVLGMVASLSPERIRGEQPDARSDLFSFGALAYEIVTGRPPFQAEREADLLDRILEEEPAAPSTLAADCPPELEEIILACLRKQPDERPASAEEIAGPLERLADEHREEAATTAYDLTEIVPPPTELSDAQATALVTQPTRLATPRPERRTVTPPPEEAPTLITSTSSETPSSGPGPLRYVVLLLLMSILGAAAAYWFFGRGPDRPAGLPDPADRVAPLPAPDSAGDRVAGGEEAERALGGEPPDGSSESRPSGSSGDPGTAATGGDAPEPATGQDDAQIGSLRIETAFDPAVTLSVDGKPPFRLDQDRLVQLSAGERHSLVFEYQRDDYRDRQVRRVTVEPGEVVDFEIPLVAPAMLTVRAGLGAPQAFVRLDGDVLGWTPVAQRLLAPGTHRITAAAEPDSEEPVIDDEFDAGSGKLVVLTLDLGASEPLQRAERSLDESR